MNIKAGRRPGTLAPGTPNWQAGVPGRPDVGAVDVGAVAVGADAVVVAGLVEGRGVAVAVP